jgi:N-acetylmuramoyl-L-alanine amidase
LILWPDAARVAQIKTVYEQELPTIDWFQQRLAKFGYAVPLNAEFDEATVNVIAAFQMRYRPARIDGIPDAETAAMLEVLTTPPLNPAGASTRSGP